MKKILSSVLTLSLVAQNLLVPAVAFAADTGFSSPTSSHTPEDWSNVIGAFLNGSSNPGDGDGFARNLANGEKQGFDDFNFPSITVGSTINGVLVSVDAYSEDNDCDLGVELSWDGGTTWTSQKVNGLGTGESAETFGGSSDKWGRVSWATTDFTNANFVLKVQAIDGDGSGQNSSSDCQSANDDVIADFIQAKVYYTAPVEPTVGDYSISQTGSSVISGLTIDIDGTASAYPFVGQLNDQHISIDWDDDGDGVADLWQSEDSNSSGNDAGLTSNITFDIDSYDDSGNDKFFQENDWSATHTYATSGSKKIFVRVHHATATGAEGSDVATIQIDIIIPPATDGGLIVKKVLINNNGGTQATTSFSFQINGDSAIAFEADGQNDFTKTAGAYTVTEVSAPGYATTYDSGCTAGVAAGATTTCTITNDDIAAKLTVTKTILNDNGGTKTATTDFTFLVGIQEVLSGIANLFNVNSYSVTEQNNAGYTPTFGGDCTGGLVNLALGDEKTCTITNDDNEPSLTLVKVVIDDSDNNGTTLASEWTLTAAGPTGFSGVGPSVSNGASFDAGTYNLSESGPTGYAASNWACVGGTQVDGDTVTVGLGQNVTCTITNNDIPLPLCSNGTDDDNDGSVDAADPGCHSDLNPDNSESYTPTGTSEGNETTLGLCSDTTDNDGDALVDLADPNCSAFIPKLIVNKVVVNDNFGGLSVDDFSFKVDGGDPIAFEVDGSNTVLVDPGSYSITEVSAPGYASTLNGQCSESIAIGGTKTCTIINDDQLTSLIVKKVLINDSGKSQAITSFSFFLNDDENSSIFEEDGQNDLVVEPGTYSVTENSVPGYTTSYEGCEDISLSLGEVKTCTITNDDVPACSDSLDNDSDDLTDANDPACHTDGDPNNSESYNPGDTSESGDGDLTPPSSQFDNGRNHEKIETELLALSLTGASTDNFPGTKSGVDSATLKVFRIADAAAVSSSNFNEQFEQMSCSNSEVQVPIEIVALNLVSVDPLPLNTTWSHNWTPSKGVYCFEVHGKDKAGNEEHTAIAGPFAYTFTPPTPPTPPAPPSGGGGGGGGPIPGTVGGGLVTPSGLVLGASTELPELPAGCNALLNSYMRQGKKSNNSEDIKKLQQFLNEQVAAGLPITGFFGSLTNSAVHAFQASHPNEVLIPWGLNKSTGYVYKTTQRWINLIHCATLNIPMPELVPDVNSLQ